MQAAVEITPSLVDVNPFPVFTSSYYSTAPEQHHDRDAHPSQGTTTLFMPLPPRPGAHSALQVCSPLSFGHRIAYMWSRTLSDAYNYDALRTGFVISFGAGGMERTATVLFVSFFFNALNR